MCTRTQTLARSRGYVTVYLEISACAASYTYNKIYVWVIYLHTTEEFAMNTSVVVWWYTSNNIALTFARRRERVLAVITKCYCIIKIMILFLQHNDITNTQTTCTWWYALLFDYTRPSVYETDAKPSNQPPKAHTRTRNNTSSTDLRVC